MSNYNPITIQSKPILESSRDLLNFGLALPVPKRDLDTSNAVRHPIKLILKLSQPPRDSSISINIATSRHLQEIEGEIGFLSRGQGRGGDFGLEGLDLCSG